MYLTNPDFSVFQQSHICFISSAETEHKTYKLVSDSI